MEEQQADLAQRRLAVAVGTPNRLTKLAELGALRLDRLRLIAVDVHLDAKQRCKAFAGPLRLLRGACSPGLQRRCLPCASMDRLAG